MCTFVCRVLLLTSLGLSFPLYQRGKASLSVGTLESEEHHLNVKKTDETSGGSVDNSELGRADKKKGKTLPGFPFYVLSDHHVGSHHCVCLLGRFSNEGLLEGDDRAL